MSQILTTDGLPLEESLKKVEQKNKLRAFLLVAPLLLFLIIAYVWPILNLLTRSVDNRLISELLPETATALSSWEGNELPSEDIYKTFYIDLNEAHKQKLLSMGIKEKVPILYLNPILHFWNPRVVSMSDFCTLLAWPHFFPRLPWNFLTLPKQPHLRALSNGCMVSSCLASLCFESRDKCL